MAEKQHGRSENKWINRLVENRTGNRKKSRKEQKGKQNREQIRKQEEHKKTIEKKQKRKETCRTEKNERKTYKYITAITFILSWDPLMFYQVLLSPQVKWCAIITYKHGIYDLPNDLRLRILGN